MDMRPPTDSEIVECPQVVFTSDETWDPIVLDDETDLSVPNDNLIIKDLDEEFISTYSSDTGSIPSAL